MDGTKLHPSINLLIFITSIMIGGFIAVHLGKDLDFDLANYHYYNPYALLHHRWSVNYWPPSYIHVFFPPTADLLSYGIINTFSAIVAVFVSGAIHGVNLWILFNIIYNFVSKKYYPVLTAFSIGLIGMYGPLGFNGIGNFKNDHVLSIFILSFVWLQIKFWQNYSLAKINYKILITSAFSLGFGAQLKLTGNTYILSALLVLILMPIILRDKIKIFFTTLFFTTLGSLLSAGYWMYILLVQYGNPVFPFLNNIFQSSDYPAINFRYIEFQPNSVWYSILYPFFFSFNGTISETKFRDFRYLFVYVLFVVAASIWIRNKINRVPNKKISLPIYWLFLFFIFSYTICIFYFGALRYIITIEMLAPLIILLLIKNIFESNKSYIVVTSLYLIIVATVSPAIVGTRVPWWFGADYFDVKLPEQLKIAGANQAMVLLPYTMYARSNDPRPQTYLIPFLPNNWRYIGIPFHQEKYIPPGSLVEKKIRKLIADFQGDFYVLTVEYSISELYRAAKNYGLIPAGQCGKIYSQRQLANYGNVFICPMKKNNYLSSNNQPTVKISQ